MTIRSLILGFFSVIFVSAVCYFNDYVIRQGSLVPDLMPVIVYGSLVLFLLFLNPLLKRLRESWVLKRGELGVIICFTLIGCAISSWGLVQFMPTSTMMPHYFNKTRPGWQAQEVLTEAPPQMLVDVNEMNEDETLNAYMTGMSEGEAHVRFSDVPWKAWSRTLLFWSPLMLCMVLALASLAVVFHQQWAHHEQLPYPIQTFVKSLLPQPGESKGCVFSQRFFWIGFSLLFAIHMNNYLCRFWSEALIPVRMWLDFTPLAKLFPTLVRGTGMPLLRPRIYFAVIGLAYFIASDVSFSMGTIPFFFCFLQGVLASYGIMLRTGDHLSVKIEAYLFTGGYFGILAMLMYTGRHYYLSVLRRSLGLRGSDFVESYVVWAMRTFLLATAVFVLLLIQGGLDWQIALIYTAIAWMIFIVVGRTIAETGAFHIGSEIFPGVIIMGVFGAAALGPKTLIMMFIASSVLLGAPGWSPMPFLVQGIKTVDISGENVGKLYKWLCLSLLLSLVIALPLTIYWQYDQGVPANGWPRSLSSYPFENLVKIKQQLDAQGSLRESQSISGWSRFASMQPNGACVFAFFVATAVAIGLGVGRLRFAKWPFHPVVFVFLGGHQAKMMSASFLIGWLVKTVVNKYGGARLYQNVKPLMIGIIAGEMTARLVPMLVGTTIYIFTGENPSKYYG